MVGLVAANSKKNVWNEGRGGFAKNAESAIMWIDLFISHKL